MAESTISTPPPWTGGEIPTLGGSRTDSTVRVAVAGGDQCALDFRPATSVANYLAMAGVTPREGSRVQMNGEEVADPDTTIAPEGATLVVTSKVANG